VKGKWEVGLFCLVEEVEIGNEKRRKEKGLNGGGGGKM